MRVDPSRTSASLAVVLVFGALFLPARAEAQTPQTSITISPIQLLNPILEITGERRLANKIGLAVFVGGGSISEEDKRYGIWEVGAQFRGYLLGSFSRGLMLGAHVGYLHASGQLESPTAYYVGTQVGLFAGYKIAMDSGFTFEAQLGPMYIRASATETELQTLANLKIGWSF
jgi:hypothetical protein